MDVASAEPGAALDVRADGGEGSCHRGLAQQARVGQALAQPGHRLVLVDDPPARRAEHVGDQQSHGVAADVDRGQTHGSA